MKSHASTCSGQRARLIAALTSCLMLGLSLTHGSQAADPAALRVVSDPNFDYSGVWVDTTNNELIVGDDNHHGVVVYARTASGPAIPLRQITGLSTQLDYPSQVVVDNTNNELWAVNNDTSDRAVVFNRTDAGNIAPLRVVDFKAFGLLEKRTWGWTVDAVNGEVFGSFQNGSAVHVFDRATGDLLRSLSGAATQLADPHGIIVDTVNNELFVVNEGHQFGVALQAASITVYARTASGNSAPIRIIQGPLTGLSQPKNIHLDTVNNEIAVANGNGAITVYARTASGNVAPLRTIAGALSGLNNPAGVFIDNVNNELVVANWGNHSVTVYARTANGNIAPLRTITANPGGPVTGFGNPGAMALDLTNNEFAVTNCVSHPRIAIFSRLANGQAAPLRVISGQNTRISRSLHGVAIDPVNNEILIPSTLEDAILVFSRMANGDLAPIRVVQGPSTGINKPQGIAVDTVNNEIALVNEVTPSITIYSRLANGDVAPLRTITSADFSKPVGVTIDTVNNEIAVTNDGGDAGVSAVLVFPRTGNGLLVPTRAISGVSTMLDKTRQLQVDMTNGEYVVTTQGDRAVNPPVFGALLVWNRVDNGNVAPKRFIQDAGISGVRHPRSVWVDPVNNEIGVGDSKLNEIRVFPRLF